MYKGFPHLLPTKSSGVTEGRGRRSRGNELDGLLGRGVAHLGPLLLLVLEIGDGHGGNECLGRDEAVWRKSGLGDGYSKTLVEEAEKSLALERAQ